MGPEILDLGYSHPRLGAMQKKETSGGPWQCQSRQVILIIVFLVDWNWKREEIVI